MKKIIILTLIIFLTGCQKEIITYSDFAPTPLSYVTCTKEGFKVVKGINEGRLILPKEGWIVSNTFMAEVK